MAMTMTMTTIMIMKYSPEARLEPTRQVQDDEDRRSQKIVQPWLLRRSGFIMMTIVMMMMTLMVILITKTARLMMMTVEMKVPPAPVPLVHKTCRWGAMGNRTFHPWSFQIFENRHHKHLNIWTFSKIISSTKICLKWVWCLLHISSWCRGHLWSITVTVIFWCSQPHIMFLLEFGQLKSLSTILNFGQQLLTEIAWLAITQ